MEKSPEYVERVKEYFTVCVHAILYSRAIYPTFVFENRRYLGITVWYCRHPDVANYVEKVVENAQDIIASDMLDRMIVCLETKDYQPIDNIIIKCNIPASSVMLTSAVNWEILEEEFRSTILRLGMLDQQRPKASEDNNWKIMIITSLPSSFEKQRVMQDALTNGEWFVDNNKLPEQSCLSFRSQQGSIPRLLPIKSYRDETINMTAYAHIFR